MVKSSNTTNTHHGQRWNISITVLAFCRQMSSAIIPPTYLSISPRYIINSRSPGRWLGTKFTEDFTRSVPMRGLKRPKYIFLQGRRHELCPATSKGSGGSHPEIRYRRDRENGRSTDRNQTNRWANLFSGCRR